MAVSIGGGRGGRQTAPAASRTYHWNSRPRPTRAHTGRCWGPRSGRGHISLHSGLETREGVVESESVRETERQTDKESDLDFSPV